MCAIRRGEPQTLAHLQHEPYVATSCGKRATAVYVLETSHLHEYYYNLVMWMFEIPVDFVFA